MSQDTEKNLNKISLSSIQLTQEEIKEIELLLQLEAVVNKESLDKNDNALYSSLKKKYTQNNPLKLVEYYKNIYEHNKIARNELEKMEKDFAQSTVPVNLQKIENQQVFRNKLSSDFQELKDVNTEARDNLQDSIDSLQAEKDRIRSEIREAKKDFEAEYPILGSIPILNSILFDAFFLSPLTKQREKIDKVLKDNSDEIKDTAAIDIKQARMLRNGMIGSFTKENQSTKSLNVNKLLQIKTQDRLIKGGSLDQRPIQDLKKGINNNANFIQERKAIQI